VGHAPHGVLQGPHALYAGPTVCAQQRGEYAATGGERWTRQSTVDASKQALLEMCESSSIHPGVHEDWTVRPSKFSLTFFAATLKNLH
jgi:hypothetical protein